MSQQLDIYDLLVIARDPSERKHKNNPQSVAAHKKILRSKEKTYKRIIEVLKTKGALTSKEIADQLNVQLNCVSGRFSELKALGRIQETGIKRKGAAELENVKNVEGQQ